MKTLLLVFALAVIALSFATARFPQDAQEPGAEQGSMAWHRQAEQQHRQERYFQELQERAIQRFEEPRRLNEDLAYDRQDGEPQHDKYKEE